MKKYLRLQIQFSWILLLFISSCYHDFFPSFGWKEVDALPLSDKKVLLGNLCSNSNSNSKSQYHCRSLASKSAFIVNKSYGNYDILSMLKRYLPGKALHIAEITPLLSISTKWRNRRSSLFHNKIGETIETTVR